MTTEAALLLALSYLAPVGLFMLGWSGIPPKRSPPAAALGLLAVALAAIGYFSVGFAFHLGGASVVSDELALSGLDRLVGHRAEAGLYWGVIGLDGFLLRADAESAQMLILFAAYLPMVATAVLLPTFALSSHARSWQTALMGLVVAALLFPLAGCWVWGGGWLAALGRTVQRGHGLVDFGGSGAVYLLAGAVALGSSVALGPRLNEDDLHSKPPARSALLSSAGVLLAVVGWLAWSLGIPFHAASARLDLARVAVNGPLAVAGSTLVCALVSWLTTGRGNALVVAWGAASGMMAVSAGAPFVPPWAALVVGAVAGLLVPLAEYTARRTLRLADTLPAVVPFVSGLWGLLAVALFADGRWGQGWNAVGLEEYRAVVGQGVTGFVAAAGFAADGPGQLIAQLAGLVSIAALGYVGGWLAIRTFRNISAHGE